MPDRKKKTVFGELSVYFLTLQAILSADFDTIQTDVDLMVNESWPVYNVIADVGRGVTRVI